MSPAEYPCKPNWLSEDVWSAMLERCGGIPRCAVTGRTDRLSVDHVVPRYQGGTDDLSNLQFLATELNSAKGPRDDPYWSMPFYWDRQHDIGAMRTAQRAHAYERILNYAPWFTRPRSQISRLMYTLAWIVGAGKTLAIPAIAFAYNFIVRRDNAIHGPRCDRVLVLTKEQAIRDQIAYSLATEVKEYGICGSNPRVAVLGDTDTAGMPFHAIRKRADLENFSCIDQYDVVVSCIQQLWDENGKSWDRLSAALARFPLIFFDEPHYALDQAFRIVEAASSSICFGLTGTPINAKGECVRKFVLLSLYDYHTANQYDASMKFCANSNDIISTIFDDIDIEWGDVKHGYNTRKVENALSHGYRDAAVPVKSVVERVVSYVVDCDNIMPLGAKAAAHRPPGSACDNIYPVHAMVVVDTKKVADMACAILNSMFEANRGLYPRERGYHAEVVMSESNGADGVKSKAKPLTTDHAWMIARNNNGALVEGRGKTARFASRFLVVVGIGREGVNNPLCGVVGVACGATSIVEHVQRTIGRQLRALFKRRSDGSHSYPPDRLDTIKIITHKAYENGDPIRLALAFVLNMDEKLKDLQTMDHIVNQSLVYNPPANIDSESALSRSQKIQIAGEIGHARRHGTGVDIEAIVTNVCGTPRTPHWNNGLIFGQEVADFPANARKKMFPDDEIGVIPTVLRELPTTEPTDDDITRFITTHYPAQSHTLADISDPRIRCLLGVMYQTHVRSFHAGNLPRTENIDLIRKSIAATIKNHTGGFYIGNPGLIHALVGSAVKRVLGCDDDDVAAIGSQWDCPQYHALLNRPWVQRLIIGHVTKKLIRKGYCPALETAFDITPEEDPHETV